MLGSVAAFPKAPQQCAHYDQKLSDTLPESEAAQRWQGLITGNSGCDFLVYNREEEGGTLMEVTLHIPTHHLLAFGGRLLHAGAANEGATPHLSPCSRNLSAC